MSGEGAAATPQFLPPPVLTSMQHPLDAAAAKEKSAAVRPLPVWARGAQPPVTHDAPPVMRTGSVDCPALVQVLGYLGAGCGAFVAQPIGAIVHYGTFSLRRMGRWGVVGALIGGAAGAGRAYFFEPPCEKQNRTY